MRRCDCILTDIRRDAQHSLLRPLLDDIAASKKRIRSIIDNKKVDRDESTRAEPFLHVLRVFETELLSRLREWGRLLSIIEVSGVLIR